MVGAGASRLESHRLGTRASYAEGRYQLDTSTGTLGELSSDLSPEMQTQVREYIEYLLAIPAQEPQRPGTAETGPEEEVSLQEVTEETVRVVCQLSNTQTPPKKNMVAPNAVSIAQAHFSEHAWFRAIYASDTPVGFVMLYDNPDEEEYFLWRLMVAEQHHGKGFGRRAIELLADYVRTRPGAKELETSCAQGAGSPEGFYREVGFERNGKLLGKEVGMSLAL
jgi:diamine N-acetyltransferase